MNDTSQEDQFDLGKELPERVELDLKNAIFRQIRDNIIFEGDTELIDEKIREITLEIYRLFLLLK